MRPYESAIITSLPCCSTGARAGPMIVTRAPARAPPITVTAATLAAPKARRPGPLAPAPASCQVGLFVIVGQQSLLPNAGGSPSGLTSFVQDTCRI